MHALIPAPADSAAMPAWRENLRRWREATHALMHYDDALYRMPEFDWIRRTFTLGFVMMSDILFYDSGYRLNEYLDHGKHEFGGYDALILWHAYPRLGFDSRNQFDFYRQMPGGLTRLRALVDTCHRYGAKVYIDYNPWDVGTHREDVSDVDALAELVRVLDADAVFLDTMSNAAAGLREKLDAVRPGVSLESEVLVPLEHLATHPSSWAQGFSDMPGVLRNKWFERRHMQHRIRRWQHDHTPELHTAWMNGTGMVIWENVFGTPVLWNERDKSVLRAMVGVQRRYAELFSGENWTPLVPTLDPRVQASLWEDGKTRLWTLVNTSDATIAGSILRIPMRRGERFYDLIHGEPLQPDVSLGEIIVSLSLRPRGIGALATSRDDVTPDFARFLASQAEIGRRANFDATPPVVVQMCRTPEAPPIESTPHGTDEMIHFGAHAFDMTVTFTVRECGFYDAPNVTPPSLRYVNLHHDWSLTRHVELAAYAIDRTPVTNARFRDFLRATGYTPADTTNFLTHWVGGDIPTGQDHHPVVWVDQNDAHAYARWVGKRLPTESEWQHAAQGIKARRWPWGDNWQPDACNHGQYGNTTSVQAFPHGATPDGVLDLCGNVWEWTAEEYTDGRTRFAILKGGSYYKAIGSEWYADGGAQPNDFAAKFLLMYPGLDRCATVGFRCCASRF